MITENIHNTISGAIEKEIAESDGDDVALAVLAALDAEGYVIVPTEQWSNATAPMSIDAASAAEVEQLKQSLREANAMVDAVFAVMDRRGQQLSVPKDELMASMREALRRTGRTETEVHDHHRAALEGRGQ